MTAADFHPPLGTLAARDHERRPAQRAPAIDTQLMLDSYAEWDARYPDWRPATSKQARSVYIALAVCILLLIAGFAAIAWMDSHGGAPWVR